LRPNFVPDLAAVLAGGFDNHFAFVATGPVDAAQIVIPAASVVTTGVGRVD
jgi:hypothetical protein